MIPETRIENLGTDLSRLGEVFKSTQNRLLVLGDWETKALKIEAAGPLEFNAGWRSTWAPTKTPVWASATVEDFLKFYGQFIRWTLRYPSGVCLITLRNELYEYVERREKEAKKPRR